MSKRRIEPIRAGVTTLIMVAVCVGIAAAVRALPVGFLSMPVAIAGGLLFTLIPASILEWTVHRYVYHRRRSGPFGQIFRIHHRGHHAAIFPTWRYTTSGTVRRHPVTEPDVSHLYPEGWRNLLSKVAHFGLYMNLGLVFIWVPAWLATGSVAFLASIIATSILLSDLFVRVHDAIHYPGQFRFVEAQPWYPFIDRHHFIHHVDTEANVNFLLPLADWCYGTLRTSLTPGEVAKHGTLEQVKANPLGHSEPAAVFAAELKAERAQARPEGPPGLEAQEDAGSGGGKWKSTDPN